MITVKVRNHGDFDRALKAFKAKVRKAHILEISQNKSFYLSPSERRHRRRYKKK